jgi:molecular chaperone HscB
VNQAYETLQDPVKRSRYLLEINGADIPDDSTTTSDTEFLMEQIELREQVESCRQGEDGLQRSDQIEAGLAHRASELAAEFVSHFEAAQFDQAIASSQKMQFIQRIQQQLSELQFELEDC